MDSGEFNSNPSLVETLAQLDISNYQSQFIITELPNEMMRAILCLVPAHHLIRLRLVSTRWKSVIEDILSTKKCLMIMHHSSWNKNHLSKLSTKFNGHFELSEDFVAIQLNYLENKYEIHLSGQLCIWLSKLFPKIEQFFIIEDFSYSSIEFNFMLYQWSSSLTTVSLNGFPYQCIHNLCAQINQMPNLKRLNLNPFSNEVASLLLYTTFARLEHFSLSDYSDITKIAPYFENGIITSFGCSFSIVTIGEITKLHHFYGRFVSSLERLSLTIHDPQVLAFICEHFKMLQMLRIDVGSYVLTTDMIEHLSRLTNLTELRIEGIEIDLTLDVTKLVPLNNIQKVSFVNFWFVNDQRAVHATLPLNFDVAHFCRILSIIFPNVEKLTVKSHHYAQLATLLEPHLNLFTNLRSHDFGLYDPIRRLMDEHTSDQ